MPLMRRGCSTKSSVRSTPHARLQRVLDKSKREAAARLAPLTKDPPTLVFCFPRGRST